MTDEPKDTAVLSWIVDNYRILLLLVTLGIGGGIAWANLTNQVDHNCERIESLENTLETQLGKINVKLDVQDDKLDTLSTDVTRLIVLTQKR